VNIDLGAVVDGYCSDLTRTFVIGRPSQRQQELFALSLQALDAAVHSARPETRGDTVDNAARGFLSGAGYDGDAFPHLTGHGIGLEVHEPPLLAPRSHDVLRPGMVLCLEPGVYDLRAGGIRTEDMFLVTTSGLERLTLFPRDLTWR
jgi:Xaa-Pro aminopeptidase